MAIETFFPSANGDTVQHRYLPGPAGPDATNWSRVLVDNGGTECIFESTYDVWDLLDLYNLPAHAGAGVINSVTVYFKILQDAGSGTTYPKLKTHALEYEGAGVAGPGAWTLYSEVWVNNPNTIAAWTWAEIDALQAGIRTVSPGVVLNRVLCTYLYVEVDYNAGWSGKIAGVVNPAAIAGVLKVNIASVKGVA